MVQWSLAKFEVRSIVEVETATVKSHEITETTNIQKHHINLVKYEKRYHSNGGGGGGGGRVGKRVAAASGDTAGSDGEESGVSPRKRVRTAAVVVAKDKVAR